MGVIAVRYAPQIARDQRPYPVRGFDKWHRLGSPSQLCADHHLHWHGISNAWVLLRVGRSLSTLSKWGAEEYFRATDEPLSETSFPAAEALSPFSVRLRTVLACNRPGHWQPSFEKGRASLLAQTLHLEEILF
jgi:hypothetical protein